MYQSFIYLLLHLNNDVTNYHKHLGIIIKLVGVINIEFQGDKYVLSHTLVCKRSQINPWYHLIHKSHLSILNHTYL